MPEDEKLLRRKAKKVKNPKDVILEVQTMKRIAYEWEAANPGHRCEGLAAPQCGIPLRIIIMRSSDELIPPKLLDMDYLHVNDITKTEDRRYPGDINPAWEVWEKTSATYDPWHVLINPVLISSEDFFEWEEQCLSVPGKIGRCVRPKNVAFYYTNPDGTRTPKLGAQGEAAGALCHELDHLNGVLYPDCALSVRDVDVPVEPVEGEEPAPQPEPSGVAL